LRSRPPGGCPSTLDHLNGRVTELELNLLQFPARFAAQPGARAPHIVCAEVLDVYRLGRLDHYIPDSPAAGLEGPHAATLRQSTQQGPGIDAGRGGPFIDGSLRARGHGHGPDPPALADQISKNLAPSRCWILLKSVLANSELLF